MSGITIAIIGRAKSSNYLARESKADEFWGIGSAYDDQPDVPRFNYLFEIHPLEMIKQPQYSRTHWDCLVSGKYGADKVYLSALTPEIPGGILYPKDDVIATVPTPSIAFASTLDWMLALIHYKVSVLKENISRVEVYGLSMLEGANSDTEYVYQRPTFWYWQRALQDVGVEVYIPPESPLSHVHYVMYGWENSGMVTEAQANELRSLLQADFDKLKAQIIPGGENIEKARLLYRIEGALLNISTIMDNYGVVVNKYGRVVFRSLVDQNVLWSKGQRDEALAYFNMWGGVLKERVENAGSFTNTKFMKMMHDNKINAALSEKNKAGAAYFRLDGVYQLAKHMLKMCDGGAVQLTIRGDTSKVATMPDLDTKKETPGSKN